MDEKTSLPEAMEKVQRAHEMIMELENYLPVSKTVSFRERLLMKMETRSEENREFREKAQRLISYFEDFFGVMDFIE